MMSQPADLASPIAARFLHNPPNLNNTLSPSPPPLQILNKRRPYFPALIEIDDPMDYEHNSNALLFGKSTLVRKLSDVFEGMAFEDTIENANKTLNLHLNSGAMQTDLDKLSKSESSEGAEADMSDNVQNFMSKRLKHARVSVSSPSSPARREKICSPRLTMSSSSSSNKTQLPLEIVEKLGDLNKSSIDF